MAVLASPPPAVAIDSAHYRRHIEANAVFRRFASALGPRRHALWSERGGLPRAAILLTSGHATLSGDRETLELHGPAFALLPIQARHFLHLAAGTQALVLAFSDPLLVDAIGNGAESVPLRYLTERRLVASGEHGATRFEDLKHAFAAIERELAGENNASWRFLTAQLAIIMIHGWRLSGLAATSRQSANTQGALLMRFRHMVERHFREHWRIARYAETLGLSHDRLHDICLRTLKRTPLHLVHDRLVHEACLQLIRSGLSIEQIAADLGFRNTTHFTRFFRRRTGSPPARYRDHIASQRSEASGETLRSFADWP